MDSFASLLAAAAVLAVLIHRRQMKKSMLPGADPALSAKHVALAQDYACLQKQAAVHQRAGDADQRAFRLSEWYRDIT